MNWYLVQIMTEEIDNLDAIDAGKFRRLKAENSKEAALKPLRKAKAIKALVDDGCSVILSYVAKADGPKYPNGVPMFLERFELQIGDERTNEDAPELLPWGYPFVSRNDILVECEKKVGIRYQALITRARWLSLRSGSLPRRHVSNTCVVCDGVMGFDAPGAAGRRPGPLAGASFGVQHVSARLRRPPVQFSRGPRSPFVSGSLRCGT
jgi:hypothetical protein